MSTTEEIDIRLATKDDEAFFFSALLQSYLYGSPINKRMSPKVYFAEHHQVLEKILERPMARLVLACLKDDPTVIIGFLLLELTERPVVHYLYVKKPFRRMGIARGLWLSQGLDLNECAFSHWTYDFMHVKDDHPGLVFNPYLIQESA